MYILGSRPAPYAGSFLFPSFEDHSQIITHITKKGRRTLKRMNCVRAGSNGLDSKESPNRDADLEKKRVSLTQKIILVEIHVLYILEPIELNGIGQKKSDFSR